MMCQEWRQKQKDKIVSKLFVKEGGGTLKYLNEKYKGYHRAPGIKGFLKHIYLVLLSMMYKE